MRTSKLAKPFCFLVLLVLINGILSFVLEPADGASAAMWEQYVQQEEIDTLFIGASVASASFDPLVFDEQMGVCSFNMGTPAQEPQQSVRALEQVLKEHDVKTVIYGMGYFSLQQNAIDEAELTFVRAMADELGGIKGIRAAVSYLFSERAKDKGKSVEFFFPWLYNRVDVSWDAVKSNVLEKLKPSEEIFDAASAERRSWMLTKGYRPYTGVVDYDSAWKENSNRSYYQYFDYEPTYYFEELLKLCQEKDVDLIVIHTPHPAYDVVSCYKTYKLNQEQVKELCLKYHADYYDFSLAKPELFLAEEDDFYDFEHLNYKGAGTFSSAVCELLKKRAAGEDVENEFYTVEEFLDKHAALLEEWKKEE